MDNKQQLDVIEQMLTRTRYRMYEQGSIFYLIWGWAVLIATVLEFLLLKSNQWSAYHWLTWPVLMPMAGLISAYTSRKLRNASGYKTLIDEVMRYTWGGTLLGILFSLGLSARIGWVDSYILIILFYALGTAVSGLILQLRELIFGGVFSILLVLGILLLQSDQVDFEAMLIAMAVSIVGTYLVPAYILRMKKSSDV